MSLVFPNSDVFIFKCFLVIEISDILAERMGKYFLTVKVYESLSTDNDEGNKGKAIISYIVLMSLLFRNMNDLNR